MEEISKFRRILPQILACVAKSLILVDIGLALGFPTTLISALTTKELAPGEVHFTTDQASWFASLIFISQPVGCILSGWLTDLLGRKNAMILVNFPHIGAWLLIHLATDVQQIYAAAVILGLGIGVMETPVVTYIGEICQPSIRGILTSTTGVAVTLGYTMVYSLGWMFYWRTVALICFTVPVITILVILFVPETPLWLLMHNHEERARKSLQWLRGWVSAVTVEAELKDLQRYCATARKCKLCQDDEAACGCLSKDTWGDKWSRFMARRNLKPFCVVTLFLVFAQLSGFAAMRPYLVAVLRRFQVPMDADRAMSVIGLLKLSANLTIMVSVKWVGKRRLSLISSFGVALCTSTLGIYAFWFLPSAPATIGCGLWPLLTVFALAFFTSLGIAPIPWMLLSEVLPIRTRAVTSGVTVTINYLVVFLATKTYPGLESLLDLHGVLWLYFFFGAVGFLFLFAFLPETENRTLEEIEFHFATQPMTERVIAKLVDGQVVNASDTAGERVNGKHGEDLELL